MIRYPRPVRPGDTIGVTAPSSGVADELRPRLDVALEHLAALGLRTRLGRCLDGTGVVSAPARDRAAELDAFVRDPDVRAVVPPWGGEIAMDLLPWVDWDAWAQDPTWLVGFSDISTLLLPLTVLTGVATVHGQNLMDTPYRVPAPMLPWTEVVTTPPGGVLVQGAARAYRAQGFDDWVSDPGVTVPTFDTPGEGWVRVDGPGDVDVQGRLIGGCLETVAHLAGTPFGDVPRFAREHAPEGLVVYLESAGSDAYDVTRRLLGLRYAGWFEAASAVLLARTRGPELPGHTHRDAARTALGDLGVPVLTDVDCGHVPPHLALVNGALARVTHTPSVSRIEQHLV
ncbi:S66 family peptidase [Cellulomonas endophytica]|uniref:S66 family peptidase n=1 Tax=Cellulomonas endophytica TaxID=2494735 RepID=UPI001012E0A7|nr:S66 peptidase family protein [Cellulomonas endophytica]